MLVVADGIGPSERPIKLAEPVRFELTERLAPPASLARKCLRPLGQSSRNNSWLLRQESNLLIPGL